MRPLYKPVDKISGIKDNLWEGNFINVSGTVFRAQVKQVQMIECELQFSCSPTAQSIPLHYVTAQLIAWHIQGVARLSTLGEQERHISSIFPHFPVLSFIFHQYFFTHFFFKLLQVQCHNGPLLVTLLKMDAWTHISTYLSSFTMNQPCFVEVKQLCNVLYGMITLQMDHRGRNLQENARIHLDSPKRFWRFSQIDIL